MHSLSEVKLRGGRANSAANDKLHFFSSRFSIYFSFIFINLGMSANQVTLTFFVMGLSSVFFFANDMSFFLLGYLFWRLHIIFDLCDGDVARYNKTFSINGAYWDYMIHSVLYPMVYLAICVAYFKEYSNDVFLILGAVGSIIVSQLLSVKNNYYRAMLFSKQALDVSKSSNNSYGLKYQIRRVILSVFSFEGFLFLVALTSLWGANEVISFSIVLLYMLVFTGIISVKFLQFSKKGYYVRRS